MKHSKKSYRRKRLRLLPLVLLLALPMVTRANKQAPNAVVLKGIALAKVTFSPKTLILPELIKSPIHLPPLIKGEEKEGGSKVKRKKKPWWAKKEGQVFVKQRKVEMFALRNSNGLTLRNSNNLETRFPKVSRALPSGTPLLVTATAYTDAECGKSASESWYGKTATGVKTGYGVVAVDPGVIPMGSLLFIEGYGYAVAADVGGAIKGHHIDVWVKTAKEANIWWGKRRNVKVWILK